MKGQEGFTLVELLVAMAIGLVVILAAAQGIDSFTTASATTLTRADDTQRARLSMDGLIRALRSQVCVGTGSPSLLAGTPTSISFVTDLSDGSRQPERRTVSYDAATRRLRETRTAGTRSSTGVLQFRGACVPGPTLSGVEPDGVTAAAPQGTGIFGFYSYDDATPPRPLEAMATPLSDADRAQVARITVAFRVGPRLGARDRGASATLEDEVLLRSVDPADPAPIPLCP